MATYILLLSFTDQGIRKKDSPKRADAFKDMQASISYRLAL
jgi:uncharacterized protein with GYD domain